MVWISAAGDAGRRRCDLLHTLFPPLPLFQWLLTYFIVCLLPPPCSWWLPRHPKTQPVNAAAPSPLPCQTWIETGGPDNGFILRVRLPFAFEPCARVHSSQASKSNQQRIGGENACKNTFYAMFQCFVITRLRSNWNKTRYCLWRKNTNLALIQKWESHKVV